MRARTCLRMRIPPAEYDEWSIQVLGIWVEEHNENHKG